ncbi:MAG: J domain-containing protein [Thermodesulfobacteriota bacterium]
MLPDPLSTDLLYACRILFDAPVGVTNDFLMNLEPAALKRAYRRKAFETHPDRSRALGKSETEMNRRFKEVSLAYERLVPIVSGETVFTAPSESARTRKPGTGHFQQRQSRERPAGYAAGDHFYQGIFPSRRLKFGQFLYYSQSISWKTLIQAIIWQKKQRPLFGQIAEDWGFLSSDAVHRILAAKPYTEKFGEFALRSGYLTVFQHLAILGKQRLHQPRIGQFFIQQHLFSTEKLEQLIQRAVVHNRRFA